MHVLIKLPLVILEVAWEAVALMASLMVGLVSIGLD